MNLGVLEIKGDEGTVLWFECCSELPQTDRLWYSPRELRVGRSAAVFSAVLVLRVAAV